MTGGASEAIPAATVLLVRDCARDGAQGLEVVMVERHKDIGFAGGALVFPGGRIDPTDASPAWRERADGLSDDQARAGGEVAAIREAFEEVGVLLARRRGADALLSGAEVAALHAWRARSEADDAAFLEMAEAEDLILACDRLAFFAHWSPPAGVAHKRFDTLFFIAHAPEGQEIRQDGVEATEAIWLSPRGALADEAAGRRKIIFPTARNLELLGVSDTAEAAVAHARARAIRKIEPRVIERDGVPFLTIPDDLGYPVTEEPLQRAMRG